MRNLGLLTQLALALLAPSVPFAWTHLSQLPAGIVPPEQRAPFFVVMLSIPTAAALLVVLAGILAPNLVAPGRLRFPLNLTIPPVFIGFLVLIVTLLVQSSNPLLRSAQLIDILTFWSERRTLGLLFVTQVLALTLGIRLLRPRT